LPIVKGKMHDGFRIPALDATPSVRRESIENTLPDLAICFSKLGESSESGISVTFFINSCRLGLDTLGEKLEQFLGILVFAGREKGVVFSRGVV